MSYLNFLKLLAKLGPRLTLALPILQRIFADFTDLVDVFSDLTKPRMISGARLSLGQAEKDAEASLVDSCSAITVSEGEGLASRKIDGAWLQDIFLKLKQYGVLDAVMAIIGRLIG